MLKKWKILNNEAIPIKERLLNIRGITSEKEESFFHADIKELSDPFLFQNMKKAVERVEKAIKQKEKIIVFGDYDVDGVTGTAILVRTLLKLGALVSYRLPHRVKDGYGLRNYFIDDIAEKGVTLLITVDNGISAVKEIAHANKKGIDVIITDHHTVPEKEPLCFAIIHAKRKGEQYPYKDLSGSGAAFLFSSALLTTFLGEEKGEKFLHDMLDLVALGTIADCVPLLEDNRILVKYGLQQLAKTKHPGLLHLMNIAQVDQENISNHTVEYVIGPRLNAGGRMDTAIEALHLFLFSEEKSKTVAENLHGLNIKRQQETEKIIQEAEKNITQEKKTHHIIIVEGAWHIGIIGIVASKLAERYNCPAIVLGEKKVEDTAEEGLAWQADKYVASCRSGETDISIIEILQQFSSHFIHYGGHEKAAGFEIEKEKYSHFKQELLKYCEKNGKEKNIPTLSIDTIVRSQDITWDLYDLIASFAPFGQGNKKPLFAFEKIAIQDIRFIGKDKSHVKLKLQKEGKIFEAIAFGKAEECKNIKKGKLIDIAFELEKNEFNGHTTLQLFVVDIKV